MLLDLPQRMSAAEPCPPDLKAHLGRLLDAVRAMASDDKAITWEFVAEVSQRAILQPSPSAPSVKCATVGQQADSAWSEAPVRAR